jgi:3-oxoadipate enol-lactonase
VNDTTDWQWDRAAVHRTSRGDVHVREAGDGDPLVLMHPLALSSQVFTSLARRLAREFHVMAVDARGHGRSQWDGAAFTVEDMAHDLAAVLDTLSVSRASVLGMSMGGCTSIAFAELFPERASALVLVDTTAWYGPEAVAQWAQRADRARGVPRVHQLPFQVDRWFTESFRRRSPADVSAVAAVFLATSSRVHAAASTALGAFDGRAGLSSIGCPVLAMTGEEDYATPPAMGKAIAEGVPHGEFRLLDGVRHLSLIERPDLSTRVSEFLRRPAPPTSTTSTPDASLETA